MNASISFSMSRKLPASSLLCASWKLALPSARVDKADTDWIVSCDEPRLKQLVERLAA